MGYAKRTCEICDATYRPTYGQQRTCSRICGGRLNMYEQTGKWPSTPLVWWTCEVCSNKRVGRQAKTRCDECPAPAPAEQPRFHFEETAQCAGCGQSFAYVRRTAPRRKCPACMAADARVHRKNAKHRRRAKTKTGEIVRPADIFTRDRFTCQLCHKRLAMTKAVPHPKAPTLDHVVPLAAGGEHSRANIQAAHFLCNSLKSAGGSQQLALIG